VFARLLGGWGILGLLAVIALVTSYFACGRDLRNGWMTGSYLLVLTLASCSAALFANRTFHLASGLTHLALVLTATFLFASALAALGLIVLIELHDREGRERSTPSSPHQLR